MKRRQAVREKRMGWAEGRVCAKVLGCGGARQAWETLNTSV